MELPDVGKQCEHVDCNRLDFLPINCVCKKKFCKEHYNIHFEECLLIKEKMDKNNANTGFINKSECNKYTCSLLDCKETSLVPLICKNCNQHYCIKHRHINQCEVTDSDRQSKKDAIDKVKAPIDRFNSAKAILDKEIDEKISKFRKKPKTSAMAEKLMILRIKNKAVGVKSIAANDRVYFNVLHSGNIEAVPVFISKYWSVGKAIDAIANTCKIKNQNNTGSALKLRLFKFESGEIIAASAEEIVNNLLINKCLINAETLILEYAEETCIKIDV